MVDIKFQGCPIMEKWLLYYAIFFLAITSISINCHQTSEPLHFFDKETNKEYVIYSREKIALPFTTEGQLYIGDYSTIDDAGRISILATRPSPTIIYGCVDSMYFLIKKPEELKGLKPRINNEKEALVFVRFLSRENIALALSSYDKNIFNMFEVVISDNKGGWSSIAKGVG